MAALPFASVGNESELNEDFAAIAEETGSYTITLANSFTLNTDLLAVNLGKGGSLTIDGRNSKLNGADAQRGFIVYSGNVTLNNMSLDLMRAKGGAGGNAANPGGGGAGLGGALLIAKDGAVTLNNVFFHGDSASGGEGGNYLDRGFAGGGGGGLGGNGGSGLPFGLGTTSDGGGGGVGSTAGGGQARTEDGMGLPGIVPGAAGGGSGEQGTPGGINGGGGGDAGRGGGGGVDGQAGGHFEVSKYGGNGGWGGGGGGAGTGLTRHAGSGGFGGGAGGAAVSGYTGGFGGGGGGGGNSPGVAGFGGGAGGGVDNGGGGGGAGLGADIFVQQGGQLTITDGSLNAGLLSGGAGGLGRTPQNRGQPGIAAGPTIFEQAKQAITFAPASGQTLLVREGIADENSITPGAGAGSVVVNGAGTVKLTANVSYTGGTSLESGTLELVSEGAAGTGAITFDRAVHGIPILELDYVTPEKTTISQAIRDLGSHGIVDSRIYLPNVPAKDIGFVSYQGTTLTFSAGNKLYVFDNLGLSRSVHIDAGNIVADKSGRGVDITASYGVTGHVWSPVNLAGTAGETVTASDISSALAFKAGSSPTFLGSSTAPGIDDQASGLAANSGTDILQSIGNEPSAVADLTGRVTKAATVMSALTSDDTGASLPAFAVGQSVDTLAVAPSALHAGNF